MRPLVLKMTAFGPYVHEQIVDFGELKGRNFFLIHGPTGSGKTSLLDAMCFALYGRSTGMRDTYRSHHADDKTLTSVVFEFTLGERRFRAERRMTKGGNVVPKLEEWKDGGYEIIVERKDFSDHIKALLGFDVEQFRQVVMLPQGQFSRFLLASSKDKEAILKTLFGTDRYEQITAFLKEQAQSENARYTAIESSRTTLLTGQGASSLEELEAREPILAAELERLKQEESQLAVRQKELSLRLTSAEALHQIFLEYDSVAEQLDRCRADEIHRNRDDARLQEAEKAVRLQPAFERIQEIERSLFSQSEQLRKIGAEREGLVNRLHSLQEENRRMADAAPDRESRRRRIEELQRILPEWERFEGERRRLREATEQIETIKRTLEEAIAKREAGRQALERIDGELAELRAPAASRPLREQALVDWERLMRLHASFEQSRQRLEALESELAASKEAALKTALDETARSIHALEEEQRKAQAAVLAGSLVQGEPCPVCGSEHHPAPAVPSAAHDDDSLLTLRERFDALRAEHDACSRKKHADQKEAQLLQERIGELKAELGPLALANEGERKAEAEQRQEHLRLAIDAERREAQIQGERNALLTSQKSLESETERLREMQLLLSEELSKLSASVAGREQLFRSVGSIEGAERKDGILSITKELERLLADEQSDQKRLTQLQSDYERAVREEASTSATLRSLQERHAEESIALEKQRHAFRSLLEESGWQIEEQFLAAAMPVEERELLKQKIRRYDAQRQGLESRFSELAEKTAQKERPDPGILKEENQRLQESQSRLHTEKGALVERQMNLLRAIEAVRELDRDQESLRRRRELWKGLADAASGASGRRITLQRYVLAYRLEEVLGNASERLRRMTQGRYSLRRSQESDDLRQTFGLDLVVYDHRTGKLRPVSSLSGGESFLASLALALALSSVVQSRTGGIRLDTILIDEGFGSLDPEALDLALSMLKQLQEGGRLVGVISHVEEIRQQVEARIEVLPGPTGSRLRWHL